MDRASRCRFLAMCALAAHASVAMPAQSPVADIAKGRDVYGHECASCHGPRGEGAQGWQRPDAHGELPPPPHDAHGHTWKHSDAMLYRIVHDGWRDPFNRTSRLTMPAFAGRLGHADIVAVIEYLKTFWTGEERRFQAEESLGHPFPPAEP